MRTIPFFRQINEHYCGPAVLQMTLAAQGIKVSQKKLAKEAHTPMTRHSGTELKHMVSVLRAHGLRVRGGNRKSLADIRAALKTKAIVIVCWEEPEFYGGHYVIVRGIEKGEIVLQDPDEKPPKETDLRYPVRIFSKNWKDDIYTKSLRWAAFVTAKPAPRSRR